MQTKIAIIAGAGPAGLTAAKELIERTDIIPIIFEKSNDIGGISKTVNYKGNRIDLGGHRFFSKSDRVMKWWLNILPLEETNDTDFSIRYQNKERIIHTADLPKISQDKDKVMLVRSRLSRIYFLKRFFSYPVQLSMGTIRGLGLWRTTKIFFSYLWIQINPRKEEKSLEDFMINHFGTELYKTFFKEYTEKVWGISCKEISADWGAQRIKGLNIKKAIQHALSQQFKKKKKSEGDINQKEVETSLIERFLYPKLGPGQMWEEVAWMIQEKGGTIRMEHEVTGIETENDKVVRVKVRNSITGKDEELACDYFFSTMPIRQLVAGMSPSPPENIREIADGLLYRDFLTVGLLLKKLKIKRDNTKPAGTDNLVLDNWIYIQEREVKVGRLQIFNNWSPFMVNDSNNAWVGMEYFCNEGDEIWTMPDEEMKEFAIDELAKIGIIQKEDVLDGMVLRMEKAYPAYFGTYNRFEEMPTYFNQIENLFLVGRNGMHKYNNSDHSMLTAMTAVDNIIAGRKDKSNIWKINTEMEYHEEKE